MNASPWNIEDAERVVFKLGEGVVVPDKGDDQFVVSKNPKVRPCSEGDCLLTGPIHGEKFEFYHSSALLRY